MKRRLPIESTLHRGQYPKPPSPDKLRELTVMKDHEEIVLCHVGLAISIASRYAGKIPTKGKDILGQALLILVECVDRYVKGETKHDHTTLAQYLHSSIDFGIKKFLKLDRLVRPPINSDWIIQLYHTDPDECFGQFNTYSYMDDPGAEGDEENERPRYVLPHDTSIDDLAIEEVLSSDFFNVVERKILRMRWEGYTDQEIGGVIGVTKMSVGNMRKRMRERIDYLLTGKKVRVVEI